MRIIFFGSFLNYSVTVLKKLLELHTQQAVELVGVVTTPPQPAGRKKVLKPTAVHVFAEKHQLPIFTPDALIDSSLDELSQYFGDTESNHVDFFITAGYGKLLPKSWLEYPQQAALNIHFSLLPKFRGANPAEWALLMGESETGTSIITMDPAFDTGAVLDRRPIPIEKHDTRQTLYTKLYELGADQICDLLPKLTPESSPTAIPQPDTSPTPYAKRLTRNDGFFPWSELQKCLHGQRADAEKLSGSLQKALTASDATFDAVFVERAVRALEGFPGVWSLVPTPKGDKRMKLMAVEILSSATISPQLSLLKVQIEGQQPALWNQVKNSIRID